MKKMKDIIIIRLNERNDLIDFEWMDSSFLDPDLNLVHLLFVPVSEKNKIKTLLFIKVPVGTGTGSWITGTVPYLTYL